MSVAGVIHTPLVADRLVESLDYAVIGPFDGRARVVSTGPPYRSVCHVERDFGDGRLTGCTGFLVAPRVVLTAGHCVYSLVRRRAPVRIRVTAGRDGERRPFGSVWAARWHVHPGFVKRADPRLDLGVVILPRAFDGPGSDFRLRPLTSEQLARARDTRLIRIAGYPSDKPRGEIWAHAERIDSFGRQLIRYSVDTCPGHSGAPIWLSAESGPWDVIAIHTRGPKPSAKGPWGCRPGAPFAPPGHFNSGVRLTGFLCVAIAAALRGGGPMQQIGQDPAAG